MRGRSSLGEALRAADPATAARLEAVARQARRDRDRPRRDTPRRPAAPDVRRRETQRRAERPGPATAPDWAVKALGRLVILTDTDLPCSLNVAVALPADRPGLVCAYLDSDLYNHFGWFFVAQAAPGRAPGGAIDLLDFGARLDVFPREGAWTFRAGPPRHAFAARWSKLNVGTSVLHIRFKGDIEAALKEGPP